MANIVKYNSRITLKYDSLTEWNKVKDSFIPLKGEVCVVNPSEDLGGGAGCLIKVGDGTTTFGNLPYLSALAADVYDWAKLDYNAFCTKLNGTFATDDELNTAVSALQGAITEINSTKIPALETAIDTLGNSLKGTGSATKTITGITYDASTNKATVTYGNIDFPDVDTALNANSNNAISNKAVQTKIASIESTLGGVSTTATNANNQANTNKTDIANIVNGTTVVPKATHAASADSATNATNAASADKATKDGSNNVIVDTYATKTEVESAISGINSKISNAMHFLGITSTALSDGATTATINIGGSNKTLTAADAGAVVLSAVPSSTGIQYEYVWTGSAWAQLGQEGSFAVKGTIVNADIASNAAIAQTKIASTLGKTNLSGDIADLNTRIGALVEVDEGHGSRLTALETATNTTLPNAINTAIDTLGGSLVGTGSATKTITGIAYNSSTNTATVTYGDIDFPDVDTTLKDGSNNAIANNAVYDETQAIRSLITGINTTIGNLDYSDPAVSSGEATSVITSVSQADGKISATKKNLPSVEAPTASGNALAFIDSVSQTNGKISATKKNVPTASTSQKGVVQLDVSGGAVKYDTYTSHVSTQSGKNTVYDRAWKTTTVNVATSASAATASDLTINSTAVDYIVWDCGSASTNV